MGGDNYDRLPGGADAHDVEKATSSLLQQGSMSHQQGTEAYITSYGTPAAAPNAVPSYGAPTPGFPSTGYAQGPAYPQVYAVGGIQPMAMEAQYRTWRSHYFCFCGDCTETDLMSGLLACCCPCFAFGQNMARALNLSWRDECLKFLGFVLGLMLLGSLQRSACKPVYGDVMTIDRGPDGMPVVRQEWGVVGSECNNIALILLIVATIGVSVVFAVWAAGRRTAIRERFGIPGSRAWDTIGWLCCRLCSLSQETRTLAHNNVVDGVWHGPLVAPPVPGSLPGVPARMGVWERVAPTPLGQRF